MGRRSLDNYYKSEHWREFREEILLDNPFCNDCGSRKGLHVHHKHYRSLWKEKENDIVVLCRECHELKHGRVFDG